MGREALPVQQLGVGGEPVLGEEVLHAHLQLALSGRLQSTEGRRQDALLVTDLPVRRPCYASRGRSRARAQARFI
eukprot:scaffold30039_cov26-Phaeocystis_antarctica.AAC.1